MKTLVSFLCILLSATFSLRAASDTFVDYQNYNHGYCPKCGYNPCRCSELYPQVPPPDGQQQPTPPPPAETAESKKEGKAIPNTCPKPEACNPAPVCGTNCGISLCWLGIGIAALAAAGAIIVGSGNGPRPPVINGVAH